jgi:hypothetical protein
VDERLSKVELSVAALKAEMVELVDLAQSVGAEGEAQRRRAENILDTVTVLDRLVRGEYGEA